MSQSAGNECSYLWPRKVLLILRTNIFCGDVPQWPPLIGSHYVDHYYATQPTVICLHQRPIMVFNIVLRIVMSTLQTYKSINENTIQLLIFRFFIVASPGSLSQLIVIFVLLWIPPLDSS